MEKAHKLLTEPFVQKCVRKYLKKDNYGKNIKNTGLKEHGPDIKVKHNDFGRYYIVECKGDPSPNVKSMGGSRSSSLNSALGQIISRMHTGRKSLRGGYNYGVAFPESFQKIALKKIPYYVCNRLRLSIFIVNHTGEVEKYDYKRLKVKQKAEFKQKDITGRRKLALKPYANKWFRIRFDYKGRRYVANARKGGEINCKGKLFSSPSSAAAAITKHPMNGWRCWKYQRSPGEWVFIDEMRR